MRRIGVVAAVPALLLSGCASRQAYRLSKINGVPAVYPPGYRESARQVRVRVAGAVLPGAGADCRLALPEFKVEPQPRSRAAVATIDLEALAPGGAYDDVARQTFDKFKAELERLEERAGCLAPGASQHIATRVAESLPMPFQDVPFYRNGYDAFRASVELKPGMRLFQQAQREEGDRNADTDVVVYDVVPGGEGNQIDLKISANRPGVTQVLQWQSGVGRKMPHYRLFLRTRFLNQAASRPERNAILLGGPDLQSLFAATPKVLADPDVVCGNPASELTCAVFPNRVTIGPEVPVRVLGKPRSVQVISTVADLLRWQRPAPPRDAVQRIRILRLFAGKYVEIDLKGADRRAVLTLPLVAGDQVRW